MDIAEFKIGIYQHYKGPLYLVLGLAHDANAEDLIARDPSSGHFWETGAEHIAAEPLGERTVVIYVPLQLDEAHTGPRIAVRTFEDFTSWVHQSDGSWCPQQDGDSPECVDKGGWALPRFEYIGPTADEHIKKFVEG